MGQQAGDSHGLDRGGGRVDDATLLARPVEVINQGAAGIVYGRSVVPPPDPAGITRALMAVVHDGATAEQAAALIGASA